LLIDYHLSLKVAGKVAEAVLKILEDTTLLLKRDLELSLVNIFIFYELKINDSKK